MASVNITQTAGEPYTWETADFTFDEVEGSKTFAEATPIMFWLDASEDPVGVADSLKRTFSKRRFETVNFAENQRNQTTIRKAESLGVSSTFERTVSFTRRFIELLSVAEFLTRSFSLRKFESVDLLENARKQVSKMSWEELAASDSYADAIGYMRRFAESIDVAEKGVRNLSKREFETIAVAEKLTRSFTKAPFESLLFSENLARSITARYFEQLSIAELGSREFSMPVTESFGITDKMRKTFGLRPMRTLNVGESLKRTSAFRRNILEPIAIQEICSKRPTKPFTDSFGIIDSGYRNFSKIPKETIAVAESMMRSAQFSKAFFETFKVAEKAAKSYSLFKTESFSLIEEWRRKGGAIISAVVIESEAMDLASFRSYFDLGVVPGYAPFKPFIPGDYTYKDALFKIVMQSNTNDRARVDGLRVDIDVPDVIDRGTATITDAAAGVTVVFAREFLEEPEITVTLRGAATVGIPRVTSKNKSQFTLHLLNNSGGFTTGTVSWTAQGY